MITKTIFLRIAKLRMTKYHSGYSAPLSTTERWRYWLGAKFILFCFETVPKSKHLLYVPDYLILCANFDELHNVCASKIYISHSVLKLQLNTNSIRFENICQRWIWIPLFGLNYSNTIRIPNYSLTSAINLTFSFSSKLYPPSGLKKNQGPLPGWSQW